ncbi:EF-hand domain-containing protein [Stappia sp.]|uniref:EF-hand domain-containing protein n=1 Tax=Stappia sp. TaxID=1870903 RepID=UPI0032D949B1
MQGWGQGQGQGRGMGAGMGMRGDGGAMQRFAILDANDDGRISDDEAAAQREAVFYAMDADGDGSLTQEEYMDVRMGPGQGRNPERMQARQEAKAARFAPMDANGDGSVSKAEWMAAGEERYRASDTNSDGVVTPWEFRAQHRLR